MRLACRCPSVLDPRLLNWVLNRHVSHQRQANHRQRSGLRALDHHESWRDVYTLLEVEPSIEPTSTTNGRGNRSDGPDSAEKRTLGDETLASTAGSDSQGDEAGGAL
jgi:hypothetical protein